MTHCCARFFHRLMRRKHIPEEELHHTNLVRCLTLVDLTAIGVGATLGAGAYVLAGQVARRDAGPAVVFSFLIAAVTSILSGLCYAEFGARVPKAGSAYLYTYVTVGEFMAFVIGWNLILEYVIGTAGVARTATGYLDALFGDKLIVWLSRHLPMHTAQFGPYVDLLAFGITMLLTVILAIGVKESALITKLFTGLNLFVLGYVIVMGSFQDDLRNWRIPVSEIPPDVHCGHSDNSTFCGHGGFAPYGLTGVIKGAATCFFAFVGFDAIATTGEEAKNPQRNIPLATIISLLIVFAVYFGISLTITMMSPYYALDMKEPFAAVFKRVGWNVSAYVVSVGAIVALTTCLIGGMFPMPRVIFAMARDGLLFRFLGRVDQRVKTPLIATMISGILAAVMGMLFEVDALVEMLSIGTLLAYTLIAASVIILRYENPKSDPLDTAGEESVSLADMVRNPRAVFNPTGIVPSEFTSSVAKQFTCVLGLLLLAICGLLNFAESHLFVRADWWAILALVILILFASLVTILISRQPETTVKLTFKAPLVPFLPVLTIFVNLYLMLNLSSLTWIRFAVWMAVGFIVYFGYGMWHSTEEFGTKRQLESRNCHDCEFAPSEKDVAGNTMNGTIATTDKTDEGELNYRFTCHL